MVLCCIAVNEWILVIKVTELPCNRIGGKTKNRLVLSKNTAGKNMHGNVFWYSSGRIFAGKPVPAIFPLKAI
jgi:hypothetical protein